MAMGRSRTRARAGWPDNLYPNRDGYKYRHPVTRKETWMGRDRATAFAAARKLNAILIPANDLVARVAGGRKTVADALKIFRDDEVPSRNWKQKTADWYDVFLSRIEDALGAEACEDVTVNRLATWIRSKTDSDRSRQTYRLLLEWIFACAVQEGWIDENPAAQLRKFHHTRQRERLTLDDYRTLHAAAPAWLQNAMDLSLVTLLRREDVAALRFADHRDGALWVVPEKTEGSTMVKLKIQITDELAALISRCRDDIVSPYLVHRLPGKARPKDMRALARNHHTQLLPEQITRAFTALRKKLGIGGDNPPTFHEIRSLGGALLMTQQGWTKEQVQALMGHASAAMTTVYLEGHDVPWIEVSPGLSLPR
jgi:integrase